MTYITEFQRKFSLEGLGDDFSRSSINFLENSEANTITTDEILMIIKVIIIIVIITYLV